jgi:transcription elongation factor Elf1
VASIVVKTAVIAPYADTAIPLYLSSLTGMRYRTLNCMECGAEFLERNNDTIYRLNDPDLPTEVTIDGSSVKAKCGRCQQWYGVQVSISVTLEQGGIPLYMQPESIYLVVAETKRLRLIHCLECGKAFQSVSDRISQVVDNRVPFEYLNASRLGPIQRTCVYNECGQEWALML